MKKISSFIAKFDVMKKHIPNLLTGGNLICGTLAIVQVFEQNLVGAVFLMFLAAAFDFFDGFAARLLGVSGELGKQLDSLADVVSFGVLPSLILFQLIGAIEPQWAYFALLITFFSAMRLAKFNIDTRQSDSFIGVPTPANALLIGSYPLIMAYNPEIANFVNNLYVLIATCVIMSYLLVAELPLIALKFKTYAWKDNVFKYIFLIGTVFLLAVFRFAGITLTILWYVLVSWVYNWQKNSPKTV